MKNIIGDYFKIVSKNFSDLENETDNIEIAINIIINALNNKNKIIFCGNGGSAADSQHLAAELLGRYKFDRDPLPAISLTVDTSAITAIANDYSYDDIFSRQLKGLGDKNDVLFCMSTSGNSKNVIKAIDTAKKLDMKIISLTGINDSEMSKQSDVCIKAPSSETNNIQEMHIAIGHLICGIVENNFFGTS
jgi:D-sedoheptulose 7-phosphate isomerase